MIAGGRGDDVAVPGDLAREAGDGTGYWGWGLVCWMDGWMVGLVEGVWVR